MSTAIYWLRNDLRLHDNEILTRAIENHAQVLPVYCFDPRQYGVSQYANIPKIGLCRYEFLVQSLLDLRHNLQKIGGNILFVTGAPEEVIPTLAHQTKATHVYAEKEICKEETVVEDALLQACTAINVKVNLVWGKTMWHLNDLPFEIAAMPNISGDFRRAVSKITPVRLPLSTPNHIEIVALEEWGIPPTPRSLGIADIDKLPNQVAYKGGESEALRRLRYYTFETNLIETYKYTRNRSLGDDYSSKLSGYFSLGCLSPRLAYHEAKRYEAEFKRNISTWWFVFEITWRDYFIFMAVKHGNAIFYPNGYNKRKVEWNYDLALFERWCTGQTGIPFVDAHIRELNQTGFMSNRGRVNCSSFLTRDYKIDWRWGAAWFEYKLLDYDVAVNWLNWHTQAFDIWYTNPLHQSVKYDKKGAYLHTWLPELSQFDYPYFHAPWLSPHFDENVYPSPAFIQTKWNRSLRNIEKLVEE